jgi:hypothetical protein
MYWGKNYDHLLKKTANISFKCKCNWSMSQFTVVIISFVCALGVVQVVFKQESQLYRVKHVLCLNAWLCIVTTKEVWDSMLLWMYILLHSTLFLVYVLLSTFHLILLDCGHKYVLKQYKPGVVQTYENIIQ